MIKTLIFTFSGICLIALYIFHYSDNENLSLQYATDTFDGACNTEPANDIFTCSRLIESILLQQSPNSAYRQNNNLCLQLSNENSACFADESPLAYALREITDSYYLIYEFFDSEGFEVILLSLSDEKRYRLNNRPLISPSKNHFVTISFDLDAGYQANEIEIWQLHPTIAKQYELTAFPNKSGPVAIRWRNDNNLRVYYQNLEESSEAKPLMNHFDIHKTEGGWKPET